MAGADLEAWLSSKGERRERAESGVPSTPSSSMLLFCTGSDNNAHHHAAMCCLHHCRVEAVLGERPSAYFGVSMCWRELAEFCQL